MRFSANEKCSLLVGQTFQYYFQVLKKHSKKCWWQLSEKCHFLKIGHAVKKNNQNNPPKPLGSPLLHTISALGKLSLIIIRMLLQDTFRLWECKWNGEWQRAEGLDYVALRQGMLVMGDGWTLRHTVLSFWNGDASATGLPAIYSFIYFVISLSVHEWVV